MTDHHSEKHVPHSGAPRVEDPHHRPEGHERQIDRDINIRGISMTVFGLFVLTVISMFAMWWMFEALLASELASDPEPPPLLEARTQGEPPGPRLQASPERDMEQWQAHQNAIRTSDAWQDREAGVARIPVGRAVELLVEEGLDSGMSALAVSPPSETAGATGSVGNPAAGTTAGAAAAPEVDADAAPEADTAPAQPAAAEDAGGTS